MKMIWTAAAILAAAGGGWYAYAPKGQEIPESAKPVSSAPAQKNSLESSPSAPVPWAEDVSHIPAWMRQEAVTPVSPASVANTTAVDRRALMDAAMINLQKIQRVGSTDPKVVSDALLQVERANGSPVLHGVRLDVLRHNLEIAQKIQSMASELKQPPANVALVEAEKANTILKAKLTEIEVLQKQLRTDFMQSDQGARQ